MQRPILNSEFSSLLNDSIQYLNDVGSGEMQEKIKNGEILRLQKMSSYDVDRAYENKYLNLACSVLGNLRSINKFVSCALLVVTVVKIPNFAVFNLFSFTTLGCSVFAFYFVAELCNHLELYIRKHIYNKSSLNRIIKFYNRDVEHINKCFSYVSEHSDKEEINKTLLLYTSKFVDLFKYTDMIHLYGFADIVEKQVEEALETDLSNGGMANLRSDRSVWSIFPNDDGDKDALLALSLTKADSLMGKVHSYCLQERKADNPPNRLNEETGLPCLLYDIVVIAAISFFNFKIAIVVGCLFDLIKLGYINERCLSAHKYALAIDNIALNNFGCSLSDSDKDYPCYAYEYYRYLNHARYNLHSCTGVKKPFPTTYVKVDSIESHFVATNDVKQFYI